MTFWILHSFRNKILLCFSAFVLILFIWLGIFFSISFQRDRLEAFSKNMNDIQSEFLGGNRSLQYFILNGYHQPEFYETGSQADIDAFFIEESNCTYSLKKILKAEKDINLHLSNEVQKLINLQKAFQISVMELKSLYFYKGFKDFGMEGSMRNAAHALESLAILPTKDLLMLRRHEKDFLLRGEIQYAFKFNRLIDSCIGLYPKNSITGIYLNNYKTCFNKLEQVSNQLGIYTREGVYNQVQENALAWSKQYYKTKNQEEHEIESLKSYFIQFLIIISLVLVLFAGWLGIFLSDLLTHDIQELRSHIFSFITVGFKEDVANLPIFRPGSKEISDLNRVFTLLKARLRTSLESLEKSYDQVKKASEFKSTFLANMSHEIRTPMNGIIGMVHLLKEKNLGEEEIEYLNTIDFSANHLLELINMILDYSKIEAGKMELESIPFNFMGDIQKLIRLFDFKIKAKGLQFKLQVDADTQRNILGDPLRFHQVIINLISNAIKFTEKGSITLRILELMPLKENTKRLKIEIEDTGIGISENTIENLFEAFSQADSSTSRKFGGTGLGLTISNQLVMLMGGKLDLKSELGKGTKFFFTLSFPLGDYIKVNSTITKAPKKTFKNPKILVVEDNLVNQRVISLILKYNNALVEVANNGLEAVKKYQEQYFDLILMDIQMPVMDGLEATQIIRQSEKFQTQKTPIIAVSANAFDEDRQKAHKVGMNDFIAKPVKAEELETLIYKYLHAGDLVEHNS